MKDSNIPWRSQTLRIRFSVALGQLLPIIPLLLLLGDVHSAFGFSVELWPYGLVHYRYCQDDPSCPTNSDLTGAADESTGEKKNVRDMMNVWEAALNIPDPRTGNRRKYIQFRRCTNNCPASHILIRHNINPENGNMCSYDREIAAEKVGRNPNGKTILHFQGTQPLPIVLHELGHCLGFWHEQNRADSDRWLHELPIPLFCGDPQHQAECDGNYFSPAIRSPNLYPLLGNYDYDSIMHYPSYNNDANGEVKWRDALDNAFLGDTWQTASNPTPRPTQVSKLDKSRVLQYYAQERYPSWGFFTSLSPASKNVPDALPNPYLAQGVTVVGTPAIAYQSLGNYDLFARGSNNRIYWKAYRMVNNVPITFAGWRSIGCCFSSDPSAVARHVGWVDVVAINTNGAVQRLKYINGTWFAPLTIRGGYPTGGLKQYANGTYVGPGIASRGANLLDVFVVRTDGRLAVSTWSAGNWGAWSTLGANYTVTARPAAVALSGTEMQLAINENNTRLYEPLLTFPPSSLTLGSIKGYTAWQAPPALAKLHSTGSASRYRVLIRNQNGRISHRTALGFWLDIGGISQSRTGPAVVATGSSTFKVIINGEDARGCVAFCYPGDSPNAGDVIQPGSLWIRHFGSLY